MCDVHQYKEEGKDAPLVLSIVARVVGGQRCCGLGFEDAQSLSESPCLPPP